MDTLVEKKVKKFGFCPICREHVKTTEEDHVATSTHKYNLIVHFNRTNCKIIAQDRYGVRVRVDWMNKGFPDPRLTYFPEFGNYYLDVSQKELKELGPIFEFRCCIFNHTNGPIRITHGNILKGKATMYDMVNNEWLHSEGRVCLSPRSAFYNIHIKYNIKDIICGKHSIPFGLDMIVGNKNLYISRTIIINVNVSKGWTVPIATQRSPYVKWKQVDNVVAPTYKRYFADKYNMDEEVVKCIMADVKLNVKDDIKTEYSDKTEEIRLKMRTGLCFDNYKIYFHNCLWVEEKFKAVAMQQICLEKVHAMVNQEGDLQFDLSFVPERKAGMITGNVIRVKPHGSNEAFEGYIKRIQRCQVSVQGLNARFLELVNKLEAPLIDIQFQPGRLPMERKHDGVELVVEKSHLRMLFPDENSPKQHEETYKLTDEDFINKDIANNAEQRTAVVNIMNCSSQGAPYIVFGPPGTGKTVTIVEAICQILKKTDKKILVCASANAHCDMLAFKLMKYCKPDELCRAYSVTRNAYSVPEELKQYANMATNCRYFGNIRPSYLNRFRIVVSTLIFIGKFNDTLYSPDYIFIDEAAQASEPEVCVALSRMQSGGQLILAGDPKQLKPLVTSDVAKQYGLNISLLERLSTTQKIYQNEDPRYITMLKRNFRSHPNILQIPNSLFYDDKLEPVAADPLSDPISKLDVFPHIEKLNKIEGDADNDLPKAVEFCAVSAIESTEGISHSYFNSLEATMVLQYIKAMLNVDISPKVSMSDVGVIAPYSRQVFKMRQLLDMNEYYDVDVGTVETFQGREKRIIVLSTVRGQYDPLKCNSAYGLGFLKEPERFNVAITRAISKLIIIGCPIVLRTDEKWNHLMQMCIAQNTFHGIEPEIKNEEEYALCLEKFKKFTILSEQLEKPLPTLLNPPSTPTDDKMSPAGASPRKPVGSETSSDSTCSSFVEVDEKDLEVIEGIEPDYEFAESDHSSSIQSDFVRIGSESGSDQQDSSELIEENPGSSGANENDVCDGISENNVVPENPEHSDNIGPNVFDAGSDSDVPTEFVEIVSGNTDVSNEIVDFVFHSSESEPELVEDINV